VNRQSYLDGDVFKVVCESTIIGDFNGSCQVDMVDYAMFASAWLSEPGDSQWNPDYDIGPLADNFIDMSDLAAFVGNWLTSSP
jgi:hypothetical protein